jgi:hypothetical protein
MMSAAPVMAQSQASSGQISGVVSDNQGAALSKATVKISNTQTGLERTVTTSDDGIYRAVLLPPGVYTVVAEASGFSAQTINNVEVVVGRTAEINITLGVSGVQEVVTVTAGTVQVQTTRSEADAVLNQAAINDLPINGRRFQDFVTLTPTAQVDPSRGQISLAGQRGINGNVNIDGVDYNQPFFGGIRGGERSNNAFTIPQESIKEFQVVASGYSAEFGRSTGGVVNAVTKSGTNAFHGSAFYLLRPKDLAAKTLWFDALEIDLNRAAFIDPVNNQFREVTPAPTQHQLGGSVGGPLKKDKIFFFASYEYQRFRNEREVFFGNLSGFTPSANSTEAFNFYQSLQTQFTQTNDAHAVLGRIDYEINANNRFNVRYNYSYNEALNANATGNALLPTTISAVSNNGTEKDNTNTVVGQFTSFFSTNVVNEFRGQYSREERPRLANSEEPLVTTFIGNFGTVSFLPTTQYDWRVQAADNITWTRGNHTFKFGGEWNHVFIDQLFGFNQFGAFNVVGTNPETVLDILGVGGATANRFDAGANVVSYQRQIGNLGANYSTDEIAFFGQDSWRIRPNLTINFGLRWEGQFNPEPEANNEALIDLVSNFTFPTGHRFDPTKINDQVNQFAPRLGFAWDPFNDGRTVVRGYSGIYYARTPLIVLAAPFNNFRTPPGDVSVRLPIPLTVSNSSFDSVYEQLGLIGIDLNSFALGSLPIITGEQVQAIGAELVRRGLLSSFNPNVNGLNVIGMEENYKNPKSYQFGIGFEREIVRSLTVGADFTYVNTIHLERNRELNLPAPIIRPTDPAQRPVFLTAGQTRPLPILNSIQIRESSARSLFRALTLSAKLQRSWGQFNAFYTLSESLSDDDNERDAGGVQYENNFDLSTEYGPSRLDARHQFVMNPIVYLPFGFDLSGAIRLRSGRPIDATFGSDANSSQGGADRPFLGPGVPFQRNSFRNRPIYNFDLRAQKRFSITESAKLTFSVELFNIFNLDNIELAGTAVTNFCANPVPLDCGFLAPTNPNFLSLRERNSTNPRFGQLLTSNNPGAPFQMQFGARFNF